MKRYRRLILIVLVVVCIGSIVVGAINYLHNLQDNLARSAIQDVVNVTLQQQKAFDNFIFRDQALLRGYVELLSQTPLKDEQEVQKLLTLFREGDAACMVICLEEGWACNSASNTVLHMDPQQLESYRSLPGKSGVRDEFTGVFSGESKFSYYEIFTFHNGHKGLIEMAYDRSKPLEGFTLSIYDRQGYGYILDQNGDILLRSTRRSSGKAYNNIFEALTDTHSAQQDIDRFKTALKKKETGRILFDGDSGQYVYAYVPLESVEDWYLLSIVPTAVIREEGDQILRNTQTALWIFVFALLVCGVFLRLIENTQKELETKEQELKYQSQLFDIFTTYLSKNTDDVYMMYDHDTDKLEYISPNVGRVLGVDAKEVTEFLWKEDLEADPEGTERYYAQVKALTPGQTALPRNTERTNHKTGESKYFVENAYCTDIQGKNKRVAYLSDRTKEKKTQNSLIEALNMAKAANEAKSAFLSSVSHDIRTPMNAIIGFLALMRDEVYNPGLVMEYIQRIDAASQHLLGLINDVLDMNKIESGSTTLNIAELNLAEVIDEINTIIRPQAKAKNQTFDIFASHLSYEHLMGDKMRINQILINLLSNAVKYTQENGAIEMRVEELPQAIKNYSRIRFTIRDNGLGMSENYLKVIFDPFTREETKETREIQGTGLGMAITKSLVDLMGGTISVESALGQGSTFTVELELRIEPQEEAVEDPDFWDHHSVTRMIVADDDEQVCQNIVKIMAKTGVVVDYATDGQTAVDMMRTNREAGRPYDLILLDWQMPTLNGLETARLIRKNYSEKIPILLLTAYDWSEIEQEAIEIGINHFMPKPFFLSTFKTAIRRVMGNTERREEQTCSDVVRGKHILVVDDIEVNRIILIKILGSLGATCDTAINGQQAVDKVEGSRPGDYDLVLMDVQMPVLNGYEATKAIRSSSHPSAQTLPIIAMTANAFVDDVREALESGMDAHIAKPVQVENLKATIKQVLDARKEQQNQ